MDAATVVMQRARHRMQRGLAVATAGIAFAALLGACGTASSAAPPPATETPAATPVVTPDATPAPAAEPTAQQLIAVAQQVYLSTNGTCEKGNPSEPSVTDYSTCPFTQSLAARLTAAQQAQLRFQAGRMLVLCHCQNGPTSYTPSDAVPSSSGGSIKVIAAYCCNDNFAFTLTVVSQQGQLLIDDIVVQERDCAHPEEIDAASC